MLRLIALKIYTIIKFNGLKPVILGWRRREHIISGSFCRTFRKTSILQDIIKFASAGNISAGHLKITIGDVIKIICRQKLFCLIIVHTKILYVVRLTIRIIGSCDMVWNKIYNDLHLMLMCPLDQLLKLLHSSAYINSEIRTHIIIVFKDRKSVV